MARYLGSVCKLCRREKEKLFLKGQRCNTKCTIDGKRGKNPPGKSSGFRTRKMSEYGKRLREKQKARSLYGLTEQQFYHVFHLLVYLSLQEIYRHMMQVRLMFLFRHLPQLSVLSAYAVNSDQ